MATTRIRKHIHAPRAAVYRALLDRDAIEEWRVPTGMQCVVHAFDARTGGTFRVSLTYDAPTSTGKSSAHTDTYHGHFVTLVANEQIVEVMEFESADAAMQGEMTVTTTLSDAPDGGTDLAAVHEGLPEGVKPEDNEAGWRDSLGKLARYVESLASSRSGEPPRARA